MLKPKGLLRITVLAGTTLALAGCASDADDLRRRVGLGAGLPTAYPLQPGDEQLWSGMTAPQRERALLFLQDGSTIRSSLKPD